MDRDLILKNVEKYTISEDIESFIKKYNKIYGKRDIFLWKWLGAVYKHSGVTLSTVGSEYYDSVTDDKIILTMLFSILDDVSEFYKDEELMDILLQIVDNKYDISNDKQNEKITFFTELWEFFTKKLKTYPRYDEFKDMFWYDFNQMKNSVNYSFLMNQNPELISLHEMEIYDCHNMIVFLLNGIDLMASPGFNKKDLARVRTVFWSAQQMARIGNWLSTWKREIKEKDLCSGILAYALTNKIIHIDDINSLNEETIIDKIEKSNVYEYFTQSWKNNYNKIKDIKPTINSIDIDKYLTGLENVFKFHIASEGLK